MFKLRPYLSALAFGLAYFLAAEVGHALSFQQASIATFWPPSGIFVGVLFFVPPRRWPWFIAAAIAANLVSDIGWHQKPPLVSLGFTLANSVEAVVGAYLLQRFREPHFTLRSRRHVLLGMPLAALAARVLRAPARVRRGGRRARRGGRRAARQRGARSFTISGIPSDGANVIARRTRRTRCPSTAWTERRWSTVASTTCIS